MLTCSQPTDFNVYEKKVDSVGIVEGVARYLDMAVSCNIV